MTKRNLICTKLKPNSKEAKAFLEMSKGVRDKISYLFSDALVDAGEAFGQATDTATKNPTVDGGTKYELRKYSEQQIKNWEQSKRIVIFKNEANLTAFVNDALAGKNLDKKMYFGTADDSLVQKVYNETGINIKNYNISLGASEVRKIIKDHGNMSKELLRGQRAVTPNDYINILLAIQSPSKVALSPDKYNGKPAIVFTTDGAERINVVAVVSDKRLDLFIQTAYINTKKRSLATPTSEQADVNTPKASSGTTSIPTISQPDNGSQYHSMQNSENDTSGIKYSPRASLEEDAEVKENSERLFQLKTELREKAHQAHEASKKVTELEKSEEYKSLLDIIHDKSTPKEKIDEVISQIEEWQEKSGYKTAKAEYQKYRDQEQQTRREISNIEKELHDALKEQIKEFDDEEVKGYVSKAVRKYHTTAKLCICQKKISRWTLHCCGSCWRKKKSQYNSDYDSTI